MGIKVQMIKFEKTSWQLPSMIKSRDQNIGPPEGHNSLVTRSMSCVPGEKYIILLFRRINTPRDYNFAWELREVFVIIWCITVIFSELQCRRLYLSLMSTIQCPEFSGMCSRATHPIPQKWASVDGALFVHLPKF